MNAETELLHMETLTKMVRDFKPGTQRLRSIFPNGGGIQGRSFTYDIVRTQRTLGNVVGPHSPATVQKVEVIAKGKATLARSFESKRLNGSVLLNLRNPGSSQFQRVAQDEVGRGTRSLAGIIDRTNEFFAAKAIQGSLTVTVDGVSDTIDYQFPASHKLTVGGAELAADVLVLPWDDPSADLIRDIGAIKQKALDDSGYEIVRAVITPEIQQGMMKNSQVEAFLSSTPEGVAMMRDGKMGRFMGLDWDVVGDTYKDSAGTVTRFIGEDTACFVPAADTEIMEWVEGTDAIPSADMSSIQEVAGRYAYSHVGHNPAAIELYAGEVRLPIIYNPSAFLKAVVL